MLSLQSTSLLCTSWSHMKKWRHSSCYSELKGQLGVSGQLHVTAALSTSCHRPDCLYGCMKEIPLNCMYKSSWGWTLGRLKHVKDTIIKLKRLCKMCAFCWFLLHTNFTMHGPTNVKYIISYHLSFLLYVFLSFVKHTCHMIIYILIYSQSKVFTLPGRYAA